MTAAQLWELYLQAVNSRDVAMHHAAERVERQYRGIIATRWDAHQAQLAREKEAPQ